MVEPLANSSVKKEFNAVNGAKNQGDTQCVGTKKVSLDKPDTQPDTQCVGGVGSWKTGNCLHCSKEFERITAWQKYCEENCRIAAYELRSGKKLKLKKTAGQGV